MNCEAATSLIPLAAGGDLPAEDQESLEGHLVDCGHCMTELADYRELLAKSGGSVAFDLQMQPGVRRSIAVTAAAAVTGRRRWIPRLFPAQPLMRGLLTAAAAVMLLTGIQFSLRTRSGSESLPEPGGAFLEVAAVGNQVQLAWSNGARESYRVFKSHDPRVFTEAEIFEARGNVWTDPDPGSSGIVFYRVE